VDGQKMELAQDLMRLWALELAVLSSEVLLQHRLLVSFLKKRSTWALMFIKNILQMLYVLLQFQSSFRNQRKNHFCPTKRL
jgi:hypothetical protein